MNTENLSILTGYLATAFLAISLLVKTDLKFRIFNTLGCISFIIYGAIISAAPIIISNLILLLINAVSLYKLYAIKEDFDLLSFSATDELPLKFYEFHRKGIQDYFPEYSYDSHSGHMILLVFRNMEIANMFVAAVTFDGIAQIKMNYTTPKFRDFKVGSYLFNQEKKLFAERGILELLYDTTINKNHLLFIQKMGFIPKQHQGRTVYYKKLEPID